jgi:hypothetical protein
MMKKHHTLRRVGLVAGTSLLALAAIGPAASPALAKPSGSIWTTGESCANPAPQNDNSYLAGETIYVRGANFAASTAFSWTITGKPGGASGDPNQDVTTGADTTDAAGAFCVAAYVIAADDWGVYSVKVEQGSTKKNDNYTVEQADTETTGDDTTPPADDTTPPADDTTPPADDQDVQDTDDANAPADAPADPVEDADDGPNDNYTQEVLGVVSDGPTVTAPPTDTLVAPSDQGSGIDWRVIVAFLGVLILAATIGLPERRRAR